MDELMPVLMSGTQRRPFSGEVLTEAALRGLGALAGLTLEACVATPGDDLVDARPLAARTMLAEILEGDRLDCLEEWLSLWRGYQMHPALIPRALDLGRGPALIEAVGGRGLWLAAQNPDWQAHVSPAEGAEVWETGSARARADWLRRQQAGRAWELLRATWKDENAETRALLLEACPPEEAFLEMVLKDRSKTVRLVAAQLLSRHFPESAFARRMGQLLRSGQPPMEDPGFALSFKGLGEKAGWLAQLAALTPLGPFVEPTGAWREAFMQGLVQATCWQRRADWALGLLRLGVESDELFGLLDWPQREAFLLSAGPRWGWYASHRPFSPALAVKIRQELMVLTRQRHEWSAAQALPALGHGFAVELLADLEQGWPEHGTQWRYWSHAVDKMLAVLSFRQRMYEEKQLS